MEQKKRWDSLNLLNNCCYLCSISYLNHSVSRQQFQSPTAQSPTQTLKQAYYLYLVSCVSDADKLGQRMYAPFYATHI
jgi:hypothetical protein